MTSNSYLVAIDNGSQSTKVSIVDAAGSVHASARVPLRGYTTSGEGRWEHPDDDIWTTIVAATSLALERFTGDRSSIAGVGLCTIRFCRAVLREDGSLAQPVMSWMDERVSRPFVAETDDARWVTTSSGYITNRLTGEFRDTAGNYQGVWPIDAETWEWSTDPQKLEDCGMPREMLFELVMPGDILGTVSDAASLLTGLPAGIPVVATSNDKAVEALGAGLRHENTALLSLGTYIAAMMPGGRHLPAADGYWQNFGSIPHHYLYESDGIRRGMWTVSWFRDVVTGLLPHLDGDGAGAEERLNREAEAIAPGSADLVTVLDWLAPADEPTRRGAILGFDGTQGRAHIYRSILEAIAFTMHDNGRRLGGVLGRPIERLIVTGGGAASDVFMRILASTFDVPVTRPVATDAAGIGAAICAAVGTGVHASWDDAIDAMVRTQQPIEPDQTMLAAYPAIEASYLSTVARVRAALAAG